MDSRSFSHTRGTAKNRVGRQARRSSGTVPRLRANQVSPPLATWPKWLTERSVMWLSGRNERNRSVGRSSMTEVRLRRVAMTLAWEIIAPLGGPVVPLV